MNDQSLFSTWYLWLAIAAVLIVVAALLLLMVNAAAKRILHLATAALGLVKQIRSNTNSIWGLQQTNEIAGKILNNSQDIKDHLGIVSKALQEIDSKK